MRARFDRIFSRVTGFTLLDQLLRRLRKQKADLLRVLDRPEIPLHTNGSENDIRAVVTKATPKDCRFRSPFSVRSHNSIPGGICRP